MKLHDRVARSVVFALSSAGLMIAAGCGDDSGLDPRYSVSGYVTYKGEPVKKATISFVSTKPDGRPATGSVVDGYYTLTTLNPGDGAIPGTYKVTVDDRELDQGKLRDEADALGKKKGITYNQIPQELQIAANKKVKGSLPGKYQIPSTTDVEKEVKEQSNKIDIELKD